MAVKIIIRRKVGKDKEGRLLPLLIQLRALAAAQPGYISGETLRNVDRPDDYLVISTWQSGGLLEDVDLHKTAARDSKEDRRSAWCGDPVRRLLLRLKEDESGGG